MTLSNMREQGVHHLIAFCLNDLCRHQALIEVSSYSDDLVGRGLAPRRVIS
jgi:hypothetical protein